MASRRKKERDAIKALAAEAKAKAVVEKKGLLLAKVAGGTETEEAIASPKAAVEAVKIKAKIKASDYTGNVQTHICPSYTPFDVCAL